jgi:hypothetical protein
MRAALVAMFALVFAAPAAAGGWATAELAPPQGIRAGDTWTATITILQHGRTPLDGVKPKLIVSDGKGLNRSAPARWTGEAGTYEAKVKLQHAGFWHYAVYDGFTQYGGQQTHPFPAFEVEPARERSVTRLWPLFAFFGLVLAGGAAYRARR